LVFNDTTLPKDEVKTDDSNPFGASASPKAKSTNPFGEFPVFSSGGPDPFAEPTKPSEPPSDPFVYPKGRNYVLEKKEPLAGWRHAAATYIPDVFGVDEAYIKANYPMPRLDPKAGILVPAPYVKPDSGRRLTGQPTESPSTMPDHLIFLVLLPLAILLLLAIGRRVQPLMARYRRRRSQRRLTTLRQIPVKTQLPTVKRGSIRV